MLSVAIIIATPCVIMMSVNMLNVIAVYACAVISLC